MKRLLLNQLSWKGSQEASAPSFTKYTIGYVLLVALILLQVAGLFSSCKKTDSPMPEGDIMEAEAVQNWKKYQNLQPATVQELKNARTATAKYQEIKNAVADGYADINVVRQNMGFHYLKASLLDTIFDPSKPELLVYNKMHDGEIALVAVEYAIPIDLRPNAAPEGFTGNNDVWKYDTEFGLWLLHAWVWEFNPEGVFNPTNPAIHLH